MTSPESRMQEMREAFLHQMQVVFGWPKNRFSFQLGNADIFIDDAVQDRWTLWQAAWSARTMPVEAIEAAIDALNESSDSFEALSWKSKEQKDAYCAANGRHIASLTQLLEQGK